MSTIVNFADVGAHHCRTDAADRELFDRKLRSWMPPGSFDFHAHLYDLRMLATGGDPASLAGPAEVGFATYRTCQRDWLGDRAPTAGLFFPFPVRGLDAPAANQFLLHELRDQTRSRGLMIVRPQDDPVAIDAQVARDGWCGFKVYHVFADRPDTFHAETQEFLPDWVWEIAHTRSLCIMLHIVLDRALADPRNQTYIRDRCLRFPNARLVLAHAARGFCGAHTLEGIDSLRGLDNVWFDTSVVCEPHPFEAILRTFGPSRLLYGSDFPVSELRGRAVSLGDGFWWLYEQHVDWSDWTLGRPTKIGIESLLALKQACCALALTDADVERVFRGNAEKLLGLVSEGSAKPQATRGAVSEVRVDGKGQRLYAEARRIIPGGTQLLSKRPEQFAPDQWPAYHAEVRGCEVIDLDGRRYLDFTHNGVGACLLGYAHPDVVAAVVRRATLGSMSSLNNAEEVDLARELLKLHPWAENVRFARGGGEAMAIAARIIRAATGRDVIAFCGYHGWTDWYLAANLNADHALDGHLLPGLSPAGLPRGLTGTALPFTYNRIDELRDIVRTHHDRLAGVIMEPTRNTEPAPGFLAGVRELCDSCGARLVFDEVTTGFRFHPGGVHLKYGIDPDVAVFAKALGNGHPAAAVIGRAATMQAAQDSFISSTYWTEGIGTVAALATLRVMQHIDVPVHVRRIGERFRAGCAAIATGHNLPLKVGGYPALTSLTFDHPENAALMTLLTVRMLRRGFLASSGFYPTLAHEERHVDAYLAAVEPVFAELAESLRLGDTRERIGGPVKQSGFARLA
jgi:glutamate-1-semialdehyde 2,1-aminomutase